MINLPTTSSKLQLITGQAVSTIKVHVSFVDLASGAATPGATNTAITTAATTDIVAAPAGSTVRNVKSVFIYNSHASSSCDVTPQQTDGTTAVPLYPKVTLLAQEVLAYNEGSGWQRFNASGSLYVTNQTTNVTPGTNDYRLTGVTLTPVMTADSAALSTIYLTPWKGNRIALYDGTNWAIYTPGEVSLAVTGRTTDLPFDIFAYSSAGVVTLEFLNWTNATTRATGLTRQDGVWTKTGDATRRYVGSCRARSGTTFHWVTQGDGASTPTKLDLFNADNRVRVSFLHKETTDTWAYTLATIRQARASANNQVDVMVGLQEESIEIGLIVTSQNSTISIARDVGIGYDSTTTFTSIAGSGANTVASIQITQHSTLCHQPAIGRHFYSWNEISTATGTNTFFGDNAALRVQSGMSGTWMC